MSKFRILSLALVSLLLLAACDDDDNNAAIDPPPPVNQTLTLQQIGRYESNAFDEGAAEIVAHDPASQRVFVVNANDARIDVLDLTDPTNPSLLGSINAADEFAAAGGINSVSVANGIVGVAAENDDGTQPGMAQFYNAADLGFRGQVQVGVLPDAITFSPDGQTALVANEGEPASDYSVDPEGTVSIIDVSNPDNLSAMLVGFSDFNADGPRASELPDGVRIFGNFNPSARTVTALTDTDPATLTLDDVSNIAVNDFFTLASEEGDPILYRVASISANTLTLTDEFDGDSEVEDSGADGLTVYLMDGESSVAQDLEPEYIAVSPDSATAYVSLQENNAVAVIDIASASITRITALGSKDYSLPGNELDSTDEDNGINIISQPAQGLYMPDTIAAFSTGGVDYYLTANEGDAREYDALVEEINVKDVGLDPDSFDNVSDLEQDGVLGNLDTTIAEIDRVDTDNDGLLDVVLSFGARSFSIWNADDGSQVFDSGSDFARITAEQFPDNFNSDNDENSFDSRSDAKGTEPEAITVGTLEGRSYAFIGLERMGGIMVYDITDPANATFSSYANNRDYDFDVDDIDDGLSPAGAAGDLGPESVVFISPEDSPTNDALLLVGNEVSGTTTIYRIVLSQE